MNLTSFASHLSHTSCVSFVAAGAVGGGIFADTVPIAILRCPTVSFLAIHRKETSSNRIPFETLSIPKTSRTTRPNGRDPTRMSVDRVSGPRRVVEFGRRGCGSFDRTSSNETSHRWTWTRCARPTSPPSTCDGRTSVDGTEKTDPRNVQSERDPCAPGVSKMTCFGWCSRRKKSTTGRPNWDGCLPRAWLIKNR